MNNRFHWEDFLFGVLLGPLLFWLPAGFIVTLILGPDPIQVKKPEKPAITEQSTWKQDYQNHMTIFKAYLSCKAKEVTK